MNFKSFKDRLVYIRTRVVHGSRNWLGRLRTAIKAKVYEFSSCVLAMVHFALITDAGLLIMVFAPSLFGAQLRPKPICLAFFPLYVVCDLVRLRFLRGATISLGFPLIVLSLLADSPCVALLVAAFGSWVSEVLRSRFLSRRHLPWFATLRRAFFYAGHHAVAGLGALVVYQFLRGQFAPWLVEMVHVQATLAYIIVYSLVSMLLIWPHDLRIRSFLAPDEEPFVRVDFTTLLLLPIPVSVFYLYSLDLPQIQKMLIVVGVLPPLFVLLFILARKFTKVVEEQERLALYARVGEQLGAPANMGEMVQRMLTIVGGLVGYRWGAIYSLFDDELRLCGVKPHKGPVVIEEPCKNLEETPGEGTGKDMDMGQVVWPQRIESGKGVLAELARESPPSRFFYDGWEPVTSSDPRLPQKTALIVFPIRGVSQERGEERGPARPMGLMARYALLRRRRETSAGEKEPAGPLGLIALARPKRLFTTWNWERGQALSSQAGNMLLSVQRLERTMRELSQKVEVYAKDPEVVRQAMQELIRRRVDVARILAVVSERSFQGNLRAVLRGVVEGKRGSDIFLAPEMLTEIYDQVRVEAPGMPPLNEDSLQLLQTVTSSLSLAFSFAYQFPDVERGPAFKELYEFLLVALDANTVSHIAALDLQIVSTVKIVRTAETVQRREGARPEITAVVEEVERLQDIVCLVKGYSEAKDDIAKSVSLSQALERLREREGVAKERLRDPELFIFLQILSSWRTAVTATLERVGYGPAQLKLGLRNRQALPLDETTVGLVLQNDGPGVASRVVVQLEPSQDYEVLVGRVDLGTLPAGKKMEPEFTLRPKGEGPGPLRLQFLIMYHDPERKGKTGKFADLLYLLEPPPRFVEIANPYTPGLPLRPGNPTFFGREDIFKFIRQRLPTLAQKMVLVLIGERRTGKTSILQQLTSRLNNPRYIPIYVDCQGLGIDPGLGNFFLSLAEVLADGLERAGVSTRRLTPEELGESPKRVFERQFLPEIRKQIGERVLLLTIDEFEELGERVEHKQLPPEIFSYLRHLIQHEEQLAFIFAGTHKVEELVGNYWSVLFNIAEYRKVGFLSREETIRLITEPVQSCRMVYDQLAVEEIMRLTACHPYFTQLLCAILVSRCNEVQHSYVTIQDVRDAVLALLETGHAHLTFLWQASGPEARSALAALAELLDQLDQVSGVAIADRLGTYQVRLDPGQIMKAMEQSAARGIVCEIPGDPVCYDFTAQLYSRWIRHYKPLSKVVEEIGVERIPLPSGGGNGESLAVPSDGGQQ